MISDALILGLTGGLPATIGAIGAIWLGLKNSAKSDAIGKTVDTVHVLTNSTLTEMTTKLQIALEKISGLEKQLSIMTTSRDIQKGERQHRTLHEHQQKDSS